LLFEHILSTLVAAHPPPEGCQQGDKRAYLSLFQDAGYSDNIRPLASMPDDLVDLLYACLAPSCTQRPTMGAYILDAKMETGKKPRVF
jgi:hypothetical protein